MNVLHGIWSAAGELCLFVEEGGRAERTARGKREPRPHPFAAAATLDELAALFDAGRDELAHHLSLPEAGQLAGGEGSLDLWLPSAARAPLPSPGLPPARAAEEEATTLALWRTPVRALAPRAAVELLLRLPERPPGGLLVGDSLRFLAELATLALEGAASGRLLPELAADGDGVVEARWRPLSAGDDRLALLAFVCPPLLRAEETGGAVPGRAGREVIGVALAEITDMIARRFAAEALASLPRSRSVAGRWLEGLGDGELDRRRARGQMQALADWQAELPGSRDAFRTCFRLSPVEESLGALDERGLAIAADWTLELLLQAQDDRTLLVPASEVWRAGRTLTAFRRTLVDPQERLLADLGRACRIWPPLRRALQQAAPDMIELDGEQAAAFLEQAAPQLEEFGFGMVLPSWWREATSKIGLKLQIHSEANPAEGTGLLGLGTICSFDWRAAIGDEELSAAELAALAELKAPLVRVRGRWVELSAADLRAAAAFLRSQQGELTLAEALQLGGEGAAAVPLPVVAVEADGWIGELLDATDATIEPMQTPASMTRSLWDCQERGLAWLWFLDRLGVGGILADDMGVGKTAELLALLAAEREQAEAEARTVAPTLLVSPMSGIGTWERELAACAPQLRLHVHHGLDRTLDAEQFASAAADADLVVTSYALALRDNDLLTSVRWRRLAFDEAQNVKTVDARQRQAVKQIGAERRLALTGTPVENNLSELWSIMDIVNPGLLGSLSEFRRRYGTPIERHRDEQAAAALRRLTGPFILRRLKEDVLPDLPPKFEWNVPCTLTTEQASLYQAVVDETIASLAEIDQRDTAGRAVRRMHVFAAMLKLKQICNHPAYLHDEDGPLDEERSGKLQELNLLLGKVVDAGEKALVFTQFAAMGERLRTHLQERLNREVLFLHGGIRQRARRDELVSRFQRPDGPPVFLLSLKAGGTSLTLHQANHVAHFDRWWNPAVEDQASDRSHRGGQTKKVEVRKLVCAGTIEDKIDDLIEAKRQIADLSVGKGEAWLSTLSTAEIRSLISLTSTAVAA